MRPPLAEGGYAGSAAVRASAPSNIDVLCAIRAWAWVAGAGLRERGWEDRASARLGKCRWALWKGRRECAVRLPGSDCEQGGGCRR